MARTQSHQQVQSRDRNSRLEKAKLLCKFPDQGCGGEKEDSQQDHTRCVQCVCGTVAQKAKLDEERERLIGITLPS